MGTKSQYISVATTSEGFHTCRVVSGNIPSTPNGVFPTYTKMFIAGSSCEVMSWPLNANGNVAPTINIQGSATNLTGPQGDDNSFTYAVDVDLNGIQYALTYWALAPSGVQYAVCAFSSGSTGNIAPIRRFVPTNLADLSSELLFAGLCVDWSGFCYVGVQDNSGSGNNFIYKFPTSSVGSVTGTLFATIPFANPGITSLYFDVVRQWIWVSVAAGHSGTPAIIAYNLSGVQQANMTPPEISNPTQVTVGPDGNIWVAETTYNTGVGALLEYSLGASSASRILTSSDNSLNRISLGIALDKSGIIYVSIGNTGTPNGIGILRTYPANSNGNINGTQLTQITGAATFLANMVSGAVTYPTQMRLAI